jgi:hypothetical protein
MTGKHVVTSALAMLVLGGCASTPQQQLAANADLRSKSVAVVPVGIPKMAQIRVISSTGPAFGIVGDLADAARFHAHEKDVAALLEKQQFDFHADVSDGVVGVAQNSGLHVILLDNTKSGSERSKWMAPLPSAPGADYYLDVFLLWFGYVARTDLSPYVPSIEVRARITDAAGKQIFFSQILYNPSLDVIGNFKGPKIAPDPQFEFANMDALKANPQKAVDGLRAAMTAVFAELAGELNQSPTGAKTALSK